MFSLKNNSLIFHSFFRLVVLLISAGMHGKISASETRIKFSEGQGSTGDGVAVTMLFLSAGSDYSCRHTTMVAVKAGGK